MLPVCNCNFLFVMYFLILYTYIYIYIYLSLKLYFLVYNFISYLLDKFNIQFLYGSYERTINNNNNNNNNNLSISYTMCVGFFLGGRDLVLQYRWALQDEISSPQNKNYEHCVADR